jgi:hypothetical protein
MNTPIKLTTDEINTTLMIVNQFRTAQARLLMAQELEAEYMAQLREKYGLDESWICLNVFQGFEKLEAHSNDKDN